MTTTHTIPETAYRKDRQPSGAAEIEPAPVTDHLTIERRLAKLEDIAKNVVPGGGSDMHYKARLQGHDKLLADLAERDDAIIARIDALAMTRGWETPTDPDPVTAGEGDDEEKWQSVTNALVAALNRYPNPVDADGVTNYEHAARWAVSRAISLGLANPESYIRPDDPRLQPLVVTDELIGVAYESFRGKLATSYPAGQVVFDAINAVIAHLNEKRGHHER